MLCVAYPIGFTVARMSFAFTNTLTPPNAPAVEGSAQVQIVLGVVAMALVTLIAYVLPINQIGIEKFDFFILSRPLTCLSLAFCVLCCSSLVLRNPKLRGTCALTVADILTSSVDSSLLLW